MNDPVVILFWGFIVVIIVLIGVSWWKIFSKAGRHGAWGLLMYVPVVNFIMLLILAFSEWPVYGELSQAAVASGGGEEPNRT